MNLSALILKLAGWKVIDTEPDYPKCVICVAPHTSNWDFIIGKLAYSAIGRRAQFLMKKSWFFFPLGPIFRAMGGIPVDRSGKSVSMVDTIVKKFRETDRLAIAITPEGTRKRVDKWRTGFLQIAIQANVACVLAAIDFKTKHASVARTYFPTGDVEADMRAIKDYYSQFTGKHPENFTTD